ncbi:MAG: agmatine deiminase [Steroidobacteraceae bacterium]
MRTLRSTPAADGFWMPSELEAHAGCWMLWPERPDNWRESAVPAQRAFSSLAATIARFEPVTVGVSAAQFDLARKRLDPAVRVVELSHDDCWMRDVGPTFVVNGRGERRGVDWRFNAWGGEGAGLYSPWDQDERVARKVLEIERCERHAAPLVNEGGAIHVDGEGTVLVTQQCLLDRHRNGRTGASRIEALLKAYLGAQKIVWLGQGVANDETRGHIDNLACFARPGVIALLWTDDARDPQHAISRDALERLLDERDARGRRFQVVKLPMPGPLTMTRAEARGIVPREHTKPRRAGERLAASYVNFYPANGAIVMPLLDLRTDRIAAARLRRLFPGRRITGVPSRELLLGGGNIHCLTQQVPRGALVPPSRAQPAASRAARSSQSR